MAKNIRTHLFCYDDHRGFAEDVRKRFTDTSRYTVVSFQTREDFIHHLEKEKDHTFCKVAILGVHDTKEQLEMIGHLAVEIKKIDPKTGILLLGTPDKIDEIRKTIKFSIAAYIPKNGNTILRIHNTVKKLISEHSIGIFTRRRNLSFYVLMAFIFLSVLFIVIAFLKLPQYF
jgi:DNA-binding NarL/FixJ family response regulator